MLCLSFEIKIIFFRVLSFIRIFILFLRVCLDLGKLEGKKKNLKSSFLSNVWFEKSQKEKNREENCKENLSCYEEKIFLPKTRGK